MFDRRRFAYALTTLAGLGAALLAALVAALSIERRSDTELPVPTGAFGVGRVIYDWRDDTAIDAAAPNPATKREVLAWLWYPTTSDATAAAHEYAPADMRAAAGPDPLPIRLITRDESKVHAHSLRAARMPARSFPVVILRGGASAPVARYTTLAEDLASHGYVVVGIDAPFRTSVVVFPDGRVVRRTEQNDLEQYSGEELRRVAGSLLLAWTSDIGFTLDRLAQLNASDPSGNLTGRLDLSRVGVFGHSFGGAQAAQFCHDDDRCTAAIDIDGAPLGSVVREGMRKPFMFLISRRVGSNGPADAETRQIAADVQSIYDHLPSDTRRWVFLRGANHFLYSDDGALLKSEVLKRALYTAGVLQLDGRRQLAVTAYCIRTFFDASLNGMPATLASPLYPELEIVERFPGPTS